MNILVTGAKGMVGTALVNNLKNIKENKNRTRPNIHVDEIYEVIRMNSEYLKKNMKVNSFLKVLISQIRPIFTRLFLKSFLLTQSY